MALLRESGLLRRYAPAEAGGDQFASVEDRFRSMMDDLRLVGRGDLSVGRLFEGHLNAMELFAWYGRPEQIDELRADLTAGAVYGVWATEPTPGVFMEVRDEGSVLTGSKSFATGAGGIGYALITAKEGADRRLVIVPADVRSRADLSGWRVRGMRATGSGLYDLSGIAVDRRMLLGEPGDYDREPRFTAGAWRFTAVQLGGIEALVIEIRRAMSQVARKDPLQRAKFADAVVFARTAYMWVKESGLRAIRQDQDAPAFALMTRGVVERAGLKVIELAARIIGTRSAFDGERIDKISRDLSLYLRQAGPDYAKDRAAAAWLDHDAWGQDDRLW
tara:strand:+ start:51621 stop:52619 length:999 start_codon:yes stop_codon:yes gene_type:complete